MKNRIVKPPAAKNPAAGDEQAVYRQKAIQSTKPIVRVKLAARCSVSAAALIRFFGMPSSCGILRKTSAWSTALTLPHLLNANLADAMRHLTKRFPTPLLDLDTLVNVPSMAEIGHDLCIGAVLGISALLQAQPEAHSQFRIPIALDQDSICT